MSRLLHALIILVVLSFPSPRAHAGTGVDELPPPPAVAPTPIPTDTPVPYRYRVPRKLSDGWPVGDLRREKVRFEKLDRAVERLSKNPWADLHSVLVFRKGRLLMEAYFHGYGESSLQPLYSCTKSVFSTVYGIAQDRGVLNLDRKIFGFYPGEDAKRGWDPRKDAITVGDLLSMTSGLDCNDAGLMSETCGAAMARSKDWMGFCLGLPMANPVGKVWMYNGVCLTLVSNVIAEKSAMGFPRFAAKYLLGPLGIRQRDWVTGPGGVNRVDYGLAWKARDMGKLGQLYLDGGIWKGKRIVSAAWVKEATSVRVPGNRAFGADYGYLWYVDRMPWKGRPRRVFWAMGYQGQAIYVAPAAGLVCVMTAGSLDGRVYGLEEGFFRKDVLGSFE